MTRRCVTDEEYGRLCRRLEEVKRRIVEGTLPFKQMMGLLQTIVEGRVVEAGQERKAFPVVVDYTQTLKQMISAGKYDWANDNITAEHFPINGTGKEENDITLFHFNRSISSNDAIAEMDKAGFRSATIEELLALGASQPELQKQFPIVALGSVWPSPGGIRYVPCLAWDGYRRDLRLDWFESGWDESCRFAAVCK